MAKANVDPTELRRFAADLARFNMDLQSLVSSLHAKMQGLEATWREFGKDGTIRYEVERTIPDSTLVMRIADRSLPFGGTWTYTLIPKGDSTTRRFIT